MRTDALARTRIEENLAALLDKTPGGDDGRALVAKAFDVADRSHERQRRKSGEPYIEHPLSVAHILADLRLDPPSLAAALLHDVLEDTELTYDDLRRDFPDPVADLVQGVTKIGRIQFNASREAKIENLRKIILAMARDIRVIILKLADRLHNMRTLGAMPVDRQRSIARETLDIYAPLANRLGLINIKSEMEDLVLRYLEPEEYRRLAALVAEKRLQREQRVEQTVSFLRNYLAELGHTEIDIEGRSKHFFSIMRKMRAQGLTFDEIYDLNAVRVVCGTEAQCYEIMGQIHAIWHPLPGRIKDYIGMPKANMYQSLHTTVVGLDGMVTEIQIRTQEMHRVAEYGIAAHWKYKEGKLDQSVDRKLAWLRQLTEWATEAGEPSSLLDGLRKDVFADEVLCFTPRGDVIELPASATPIDFAYAIHTEVGNHCVGARVNRRMVSLRYGLKHGDMVEILTSSSGHPSRDWLDVVQTGRARSKIKHWLKSAEMEKWVQDGRNALQRLIQERNLEIPRAELDQALDTLLEPFQMQTRDDVLAEIGFGTISAQAALSRMNPDWARTRRRAPVRPGARERRQGAILVDGMEDVPLRIGACCNPIPGDPIVAFITRGRGVTIHHQDCHGVARQRQVLGEGARLLPAAWNTSGPIAHTVSLRIEALDRIGLLADLTGQISRNEASIFNSHTRTNRDRGTAVVRFEIDINDIRQLDRLLGALRDVRGVTRVDRSNRPM